MWAINPSLLFLYDIGSCGNPEKPRNPWEQAGNLSMVLCLGLIAWEAFKTKAQPGLWVEEWEVAFFSMYGVPVLQGENVLETHS